MANLITIGDANTCTYSNPYFKALTLSHILSHGTAFETANNAADSTTFSTAKWSTY